MAAYKNGKFLPNANSTTAYFVEVLKNSPSTNNQMTGGRHL